MTTQQSSLAPRVTGAERYASAEAWVQRWPVNDLALSALRGMGMSDWDIAAYYRVQIDQVRPPDHRPG